MTASPRSLAWSPISGSLDQVLECEKLQSAHCPHTNERGAQRTNIYLVI